MRSQQVGHLGVTFVASRWDPRGRLPQPNQRQIQRAWMELHFRLHRPLARRAGIEYIADTLSGVPQAARWHAICVWPQVLKKHLKTKLMQPPSNLQRHFLAGLWPKTFGTTNSLEYYFSINLAGCEGAGHQDKRKHGRQPGPTSDRVQLVSACSIDFKTSATSSCSRNRFCMRCTDFATLWLLVCSVNDATWSFKEFTEPIRAFTLRLWTALSSLILAAPHSSKLY